MNNTQHINATFNAIANAIDTHVTHHVRSHSSLSHNQRRIFTHAYSQHDANAIARAFDESSIKYERIDATYTFIIDVT
jgi:hypothetical protein